MWFRNSGGVVAASTQDAVQLDPQAEHRAAESESAPTRKHHQLAHIHIFHGAIITLMKWSVSYTSSHGVMPLEQSWHQWVEIQSSSDQTAFFGFVMDMQHSFMFGHTIGHTCVLSLQDVHLPLPSTMSGLPVGMRQRYGMGPHDAQRLQVSWFLPVPKRLIARTLVPRCNAYARLILHRLSA